MSKLSSTSCGRQSLSSSPRIPWFRTCRQITLSCGPLAAVTAGAGVTVLPRYLCESELASGALVPLLTPDDPPINTGLMVERASAPSRAPATVVRDQFLTAARSW
ncbi:LysR substrate-binding domain-containing protein [Streptomyces sp. NPDC056785]|uniref:LysR substrate-binding domain-containing protein n=1 Tax=Streptomyces sp. NPDC056785 TaxID=3345944 RepID=UPI0036C1B38E